MRKTVRRTFWIIAAVLLTVVCTSKLSQIVVQKDAYGKNAEFMSRSEEYDVLFFGTSHMMEGVLPMELWDGYGITSYNLAGNAHSIPTTYWIMMNALDYASPQLVVVDCFRLEADGKSSGSFGHQSFDSIPFSPNKVRAVWDIYDSANERIAYLWNYSLYHDRWNVINQDEIMPQPKPEKGAYFGTIVAEPDPAEPALEEAAAIESDGVDYLRKLIEECQRRDIEILLTFVPFPATAQDRQSAGYAEKLAQEYGVDYINFLDLDTVNYETDCNDAFSHLNASGAGKVTDYLGAYMKERYNVADHRSDELADRWNADYQNYLSYKISRIAGLESLKNCLMMLSDPNLSCCVYVREDSGLWKSDDVYAALIRNIAGQEELSGLWQAQETDGGYLLVADKGSGQITEYTGAQEAEVNTSFGRVCCAAGSEGRVLYVGEGEQNYLAEQEDEEGFPAVTVIVVNNLNGSVVHVGRFYDEYRVRGEK